MKLMITMSFCALAVSLSASPTHAKAPSGPPADTVAGVDRCVDLFFDGHGILNVNNHCSSTIRVKWFFGKSISAGATLTPQQSTSTGRDHADLDKWGNIRYYACPVDHAHFLDANGKGIQDGTVTTYSCGVTE